MIHGYLCIILGETIDDPWISRKTFIFHLIQRTCTFQQSSESSNADSTRDARTPKQNTDQICKLLTSVAYIHSGLSLNTAQASLCQGLLGCCRVLGVPLRVRPNHLSRIQLCNRPRTTGTPREAGTGWHHLRVQSARRVDPWSEKIVSDQWHRQSVR